MRVAGGPPRAPIDGISKPIFWFGLAAIAAPILVHCAPGGPPHSIPALVLLDKFTATHDSRRTLHNLLLLLLRCLAILLIVLAFTRPFFSGRSAAKENLSAGGTVILIDDSLSMRREQLFAEAQRRAESVIDDARNDERLALVTFAKRYTVISRFGVDKNRLITAVKSLSAGWEGTDYERLRGAESLLTG